MLYLLNLLFAGVLAGLEIGVHYGLGTPPEILNASAQIRLRQAMILRLRILAPLVFFPTLASSIAVTYLARAEPGFSLRCVALGALLAWIIIRAFRTVPVNSTTLTWSPEAPPQNWRSLIEGAEQFHVVAAWAAVLAFACLLFARLHPQLV